VFVVAVCGLVVVVAHRAAARRRVGLPLSGAIVALAFGTWAAFHSGRRLPWNGFAMRVVRLGRIRGAWSAGYSDQVRLVQTHHGNITQHSYRTDLLAHVFGIPLAIAGALALMWALARSSRRRVE
jgi:hypothetical protein